MQDLRVSERDIAAFQYFDASAHPMHSHEDVELLYVLEGELSADVGGERHRLAADRFLLINPQVPHAHVGESAGLYVCLHINHHWLTAEAAGGQMEFVSTPIAGSAETARELSALCMEAFQAHSGNEANSLRQRGLYHLLANQLLIHFRAPSRAGNTRDDMEANRKHEIYQYLHVHFNSSVMLEDLAKHLYLSPAYLSKYFRKHFGMTFLEYLNQIRLENALREMDGGERSLTRIAMGSGFPNPASFARVFRQARGITPSAYLDQLRPGRQRAPKEQHLSELSEKVQQFWQARQMSAAPMTPQAAVTADANAKSYFSKFWNRMVNIGVASNLLNADIRAHILMMRDELGFHYVRFGDLYSPTLLLNIAAGQERYNFSRLDRAFDFLVDNNMRPYLELGSKPILVARAFMTGEDFVVSEERALLFKSPGEYEAFVRAFIAHYTDRYGLDEVEQWYFEQWLDPRQVREGSYDEYFAYFEAASRALKDASPHMRLGGCGLSIDRDDCLGVLSAWRQTGAYPDFLTMYCYPYTNQFPDKKHSSIRAQIADMREIAAKTGFDQLEIHMTEWNFTVSDRNTLNDSCFKGAYIIHSILDTGRNVALMGYWAASDILSEYTDTKKMLYGSGGLISRDGIKKPAYFAFQFMNRLEKYLLAQHSNCLLASNGHDKYTAVCHNYRPPNFKFFLRPEDEIRVLEHHSLFEDQNDLTLSLHIENVRNGMYRVKILSVSEQHGSAQNECAQLSLNERATADKEDLDYLKRICTPRITVSNCVIQDGVLRFQTNLSAQEIQFISLTRDIESN